MSGFRAEPWTKRKPFFSNVARQLAEEIPSLLPFRSGADAILQLGASPENGPLRAGVEAFGIKQGALIVIAQQANLALHDQVDAFAGVGTIAHQVAKAVNLGNSLTADVGEDGPEGFEVAMDVADKGSFHARSTFAIRMLAVRGGKHYILTQDNAQVEGGWKTAPKSRLLAEFPTKATPNPYRASE